MFNSMLSRAQGCIMGQFAGDSLGALVEFGTADSIRRRFSNGVRELADGGVYSIIAGQPTDDSEMAISLAKSIITNNGYNPQATLAYYKEWMNSNPFDIGMTTTCALHGDYNPQSQANGALMRVSPLGIFGANHSSEQVEQWAKQDCMLTHINTVCVQVNQLYTSAIAYAIRTICGRHDLYNYIAKRAANLNVSPSIILVIDMARNRPPRDYITQQGWVLIAFQNALWQLLHAKNTEEGIVYTIMHGGDTDTNACVCGIARSG